MATQAPALPPLYGDLTPLQRQVHGDKQLKRLDKLPQLAQQHAIPLTVDEFALAQRHFPIIFSAGDQPVPLALMGLHEGVNTFFSEDGSLIDDSGAPAYIPAYIRRYPFLLAKLQPESDQLSLCIDTASGALVDKAEDGTSPVFEGEEPSAAINEVLQFCEQFEQAGQRTGAFMEELKAMDLLMDGEVAIQPEGSDQPFLYRGFQMVDEDKFRNLTGDKLRKINQNGMLGIIMAHLFSLALVRDIFARQVAQKKGPEAEQLAGQTADATA